MNSIVARMVRAVLLTGGGGSGPVGDDVTMPMQPPFPIARQRRQQRRQHLLRLPPVTTNGDVVGSSPTPTPTPISSWPMTPDPWQLTGRRRRTKHSSAPPPPPPSSSVLSVLTPEDVGAIMAEYDFDTFDAADDLRVVTGFVVTFRRGGAMTTTTPKPKPGSSPKKTT